MRNNQTAAIMRTLRRRDLILVVAGFSSSLPWDRRSMHRLCLVTGGAGFIGTAVAPHLCQRFDRVVIADCLHPQVHPSEKRSLHLPAQIELLAEDICSVDAWDRILDRGLPQAILHLAAETGTGQSLNEATRHGLVNVVGLTRMLDALSKRSCLPEQIVLTSSRAVYGEGAWLDRDGSVFYPGQRSAEMLGRGEWSFPNATPQPSTAGLTVPHPTSIYGATKLAQEHLLQAWAQAFAVPHSILRLQNVYGPGQSLRNHYTGVVTLFARLARAGESIPLYEDGAMVRDFVFITDVVDAIVRCLDRPPPNFRLCDIGSGISTTVGAVARMIARRYAAPMPHVSGAYRNGDVRSASCSVTAAAADLGWIPRHCLARGLEALCGWVDKEFYWMSCRSSAPV